MNDFNPYVSRYLHFTLLYVVVSQQFDEHLYLTVCVNAHNHNACLLTMREIYQTLHYFLAGGATY